ncbi:PREDICTED: uncharacterized protein LOC107083853 [Cyprinodon variegatus]|uniref:uncharacterized protein LOC107083853 n=1 Tax=Cyprinodon variegatus TaxID=28743 RepID=UPI0007425CCB|nr:PREDICTED: uncharacterized protein LOC107083853 [Cyprinodon variegatus]
MGTELSESQLVDFKSISSESKIRMDQQRPESSHHFSAEDKTQINEESPESHLPRCLFMTDSKQELLDFKDEGPSENKTPMKYERPESPASSRVSIRSERSKSEPLEFNSVSSKSKIQINEERPEYHLPRCLSMTESKHEALDFKDKGPSENKIQMDKRLEPSQPTSVSMSTEQSEDEPDEIEEQCPSVHEILSRMRPLSNKRPSRRSSGHENKSHLDSVFKVLEDDIMHFVTSELRKIKNMLSPEGSGRYSENKEDTADEEMHGKINRDAFLKITINFLRRRNEERLAESLLNKAQTAVYQFKLKSHLVKKCRQFFEGNVKKGNPKSISQIYTQLYVAADEREVKDEDEDQQIESASLVPGGSETTVSCEEIFKPERDEKIRTLVTKGVSGIGKTVLTQKLCSCNLSQRSCIPLASMLAADRSCLRELDLSDNDLRDDGVEILSQGLMNKKCRLEVLSLSGCLVSERGFASLASALTCNPSHLRELDLSFNHPGESELRKISAGMKDQGWRLQTLKTDHCGKLRLNPSPQRLQ